jgi:hypothetical protein
MPESRIIARRPRWYWIPARVLVVTFLVGLLAFAVSLLLGIIGITLGARARGIHPELRVVYRQIAAPAAAVVAGIVLVSAVIMEIRHYRQQNALADIERSAAKET